MGLAGGLIFLAGCIVGSFLNVLVYRLPRKINFVRGRSFCPHCRKKILWFDNIPLLSFVLLKGKCRGCKYPISLRYPLVELTTGVLFFLSYLSHLSILGYLLFSGLIVIFFIDLEHWIIPDEIVIPLIILFSFRHFVYTVVGLQSTVYCLQQFLAAAISFLFLYFIYLITKGKGMGFGDVKLAFLMGLVLGFPKIVVAMYLAFLTGALVGVILVIARKAKLKQKIAFGPFLAFATTAAFLWGEKILIVGLKVFGGR